jgi:hypothetical protein
VAGVRGAQRTRLVLVAGGLLAAGVVAVRLWLPPAEPVSAPAPLAPSPAGTRLEATVPATAAPTPAPPAPTPTTGPRRLAAEAFGRLPPLAMPGEGAGGPRPSLTYERAADLGTLPARADVYQLTWPEHTVETVRDLSHRLGLNGPIDILGPGAYQVLDRSQGRLFVAHGRVVFSRPGEPAGGSPNPDQAAEQARRWLDERRLLPADAGPPRARPVPDAGLITVTFVPRTPLPLITPEPALVITLDGQGVVRELDSLWPAEQQIAAYPLADLTRAWAAIEQGDGYVELDLDPPPAPGRRLTGRVQVTRASLGYALAGGPDAAAAAYLEPVYIFSGVAYLADQGAPIACRIYLPALRDYRWPRG